MIEQHADPSSVEIDESIPKDIENIKEHKTIFERLRVRKEQLWCAMQEFKESTKSFSLNSVMIDCN